MWILKDVSQALLDEVGDESLRSVLVLQQDMVRRGDLVSIKAVQQSHTDHGSW